MNPDATLRIYALGHFDEQLSSVPQGHPAIQAVDLRFLEIGGQFQGNQLCENKIYLDSRFTNPDTDYVGFVSASWDNKWRGLRRTRLRDLATIGPLEPDLVWIVESSGERWVECADQYQPGFKELMADLGMTFGLSMSRPSFWRNNFICHHSVFRSFLAKWRSIFDHYHAKYGFNIPFNNERYRADRHAAYFYERVTTAIFSDMNGVRFRVVC